MALTQQDLQAIRDVIQQETAPIKSDIAEIKAQQNIHTGSITTLENSVMHELKLLSENLPNAIARHEELVELVAKADNHDHRIFALEQVANR